MYNCTSSTYWISMHYTCISTMHQVPLPLCILPLFLAIKTNVTNILGQFSTLLYLYKPHWLNGLTHPKGENNKTISVHYNKT